MEDYSGILNGLRLFLICPSADTPEGEGKSLDPPQLKQAEYTKELFDDRYKIFNHSSFDIAPQGGESLLVWLVDAIRISLDLCNLELVNEYTRVLEEGLSSDLQDQTDLKRFLRDEFEMIDLREVEGDLFLDKSEFIHSKEGERKVAFHVMFESKDGGYLKQMLLQNILYVVFLMRLAKYFVGQEMQRDAPPPIVIDGCVTVVSSGAGGMPDGIGGLGDVDLSNGALGIGADEALSGAPDVVSEPPVQVSPPLKGPTPSSEVEKPFPGVRRVEVPPATRATLDALEALDGKSNKSAMSSGTFFAKKKMSLLAGLVVLTFLVLGGSYLFRKKADIHQTITSQSVIKPPALPASKQSAVGSIVVSGAPTSRVQTEESSDPKFVSAPEVSGPAQAVSGVVVTSVKSNPSIVAVSAPVDAHGGKNKDAVVQVAQTVPDAQRVSRKEVQPLPLLARTSTTHPLVVTEERDILVCSQSGGCAEGYVPVIYPGNSKHLCRKVGTIPDPGEYLCPAK